ncbi:sensor histidine kinase [Cryobacterium aureum]|uniref:sensor histidine kinase n=1 Tax=Cryobacterium aureum TaxID=995037 RepID=UPI000CF3EAE5|nr:histidine kinase [Cryobacterium aureum]
MIPWPPPTLTDEPRIIPVPASNNQRLAPWSRIWRYLASIATAIVFLALVIADYSSASSDSHLAEATLGGLILLDLVLGVVALCLLPLRRRRPLLIAVVTAALSSVSASALAAAIWAAISISTQRRWGGVVVVGGIWAVATFVYETIVRASVSGIAMYPAPWVSIAVAIAIYAISVATGFYIGARRDLLISLRERAENAEREQTLRDESARGAERTRIAREMHDVLAHRISLVALHAGALTFRTDLTREETAQAAGIIQDNAHLALSELREVLGVLRGRKETGDSGHPEPAQPTLADLPALLTEAREAGTTITLQTGASGSAWSDATTEGLSKTVSRTAYRTVQEAFTNARKHAPGQPVTLRIEHSGDLLTLGVRNPIDPREHAAGPPGSGVGLIGLQERADLVGGRIRYSIEPDGFFLLQAWLPWT